MGTRSLTIVKNEQGAEILNMYRQMDGYPSGHGVDLCEFLKDFKVVDGYNSTTPERSANGMGCMAAQIVAHFKTGIGGFYLEAPGARDLGEEYVYTIEAGTKGVVISVLDVWKRRDNAKGAQSRRMTPEAALKKFKKS